MKKILPFFILLLLTAVASAQHTLSFNQVLAISNSGGTVPAGKVWKVTGYYQSGLTVNVTSSTFAETSCTNPGAYQHPLVINSKNYFMITNAAIATGTTSIIRGISANNTLPIWLAANATIATTCPDDFISVIEFIVN